MVRVPRPLVLRPRQSASRDATRGYSLVKEQLACFANRPGWSCALAVRGGSWLGSEDLSTPLRLDDQWSVEILDLLGAVVFNAVLCPIISAEKIEADRILCRCDQIQQPPLELGELRRVHLALKDRILYPLAVVQARPGDPMEPTASFGRARSNIIGHQNEHRGSLPDERRVCVDVAAKVTSQESCLQMYDQARSRLLAKERMLYSFLLALLIGG